MWSPTTKLLYERRRPVTMMNDPQEPLGGHQETVNDHLQTADIAERSGSVDEEDGASSYRSDSRSPELRELYYGEEEEVPVELGRAIAVSLLLVYSECIDCL